jgi:hypothetical protein
MEMDGKDLSHARIKTASGAVSPIMTPTSVGCFDDAYCAWDGATTRRVAASRMSSVVGTSPAASPAIWTMSPATSPTPRTTRLETLTRG